MYQYAPNDEISHKDIIAYMTQSHSMTNNQYIMYNIPVDVRYISKSPVYRYSVYVSHLTVLQCMTDYTLIP